MSAYTRSVSLDGLNGRTIEIEVDIAPGLPRITLVGLPDASVAEARDRCRAAVINTGCKWPDSRITINLAPSSLPKSGSHYDLAIALAVLAASGVVPALPLEGAVVVGELALDGRLRSVAGVLPATLAALDAGCKRIFVPEANASEAALVEGMRVIGLRSLRHAVALLCGEPIPDDPPVEPLPPPHDTVWSDGARLAGLDLADIHGQLEARLSIVVAAAGGHHVFMTGPPGIGKTMLAQRMPGLLPDLDYVDSLATSAVHSVAGMLPAEAPLLSRPPFLDPHHTASAAAIVGGGSKAIRPGALSLAHNGILFLDEAPEFASNVINSLRQPLESGRIVVSRAAQTLAFPARFQLVLAANPCPCGLNSASSNLCECSPLARRRYRDRISGPIRDRIDIHRGLSAPARNRDGLDYGAARSTFEVAALVAVARKRQTKRFVHTPWRLNSDVPGSDLRKRWPLTGSGQSRIDSRVQSGKLSARSADRVARLAWTIADLTDVDRPGTKEVDDALAFRQSMPLAGDLRMLVEHA